MPRPGLSSKVSRASLWLSCAMSTRSARASIISGATNFSPTKAFEVHRDAQKDARLARENARLKILVGELTLELKKTTSSWDEPATLPPDRHPRRGGPGCPLVARQSRRTPPALGQTPAVAGRR